ncbi:MAG: heterodisulfide reductase-related iron-sulfur binding cluster [Thermodesulfobacteriota bacterium]
MPETKIDFYYFPGCSMATTARECNQSLVRACDLLGLRLIELRDWNCCGTSSAHSLDPDLALGLAARNLTLVEDDKPLLIMCPSCFRNLAGAHQKLTQDPMLARSQERKWGRPIRPDLKIITFLEILHFLERLRRLGAAPEMDLQRSLAGLRVAAYYGCMGMFPPALRRVLPPDLLERQIKTFGAEVLLWRGRNRCCGTFLTATNPEVSTPLVNGIMQSALDVGADCLVTACAMCQLNLEIRCTLDRMIPTLHFSELIALVLGAQDYEGWFNRHLVDPRPLLKEKALIA